MRFLVFSDLHLNLWKYGATQMEGMNSRLQHQAAFVRHLFRYAEEKSVDYILFCGDWFHTHGIVSTEVLYISSQIMENKPPNIPMIMLVGNHDVSTKDCIIHSMGHMADRNTCIVDKPMVITSENGPDIWAHPYTEDERGLTGFLGGAEPGSLVLLHQGVRGVPVTAKGFTLNETLKPEMVPDHVLYAFSGHYHTYCRVNDSLYIPGAPMQYTWTDKEQVRGWLDVTIEGTTSEVSVVPYEGAPKFVEIKADELQPRAGELHGNFVRIIAPAGTTAIQGLRDTAGAGGALSVEVRVESEEDVRVAVDTDKFSTPDEVFDQYVKIKEISPEYVTVGTQIIEGKYRAPDDAESK